MANKAEHRTGTAAEASLPIDLEVNGLDFVDPAFLGCLGLALYTTDADGPATFFNDAAVDLWGRRPVLGEEFWCGSWRIYWPDGSPVSLEECPMAVTVKENGPVRGAEVVVERPDGSRSNVLPYPTPLRDRAGLIGAVNVLVDITERKQVEEAANRLAAVIESSDDAIVTKDLDGVIKSWNRGAERMFGYTEAEVIGRSIRLIIPPDKQSEEDQVLALIRKGERIDHFETVRQRKNGSLLDISLTVSPIKDSSGRVIGASKIARDIGERKAAEESMRQSLALKDQFLGLVSHELKTPITTIVGNGLILKKLADRLSTAEAQQAIDDLVSEATKLHKTIDNLFLLTRLEAGSVVELESTDLVCQVSRAVDVLRQRHPDREVRLKLAEDVPLVYAQPDYLDEVLENLLSNAYKYSPPDSTVEVEVVRTPDDSASIRILDRGIGLTEEQLDRLFTPFYRSDRARSLAGGLGLGLALSKRIVEAQGGVIEASPRQGGGAEFCVTLPAFEMPAEA